MSVALIKPHNRFVIIAQIIVPVKHGHEPIGYKVLSLCQYKVNLWNLRSQKSGLI